MTETCKTCRKEFDSGIWLAPQFPDERVLLFCSEACKQKYLKRKLERIKAEYPRYYEKVTKLMAASGNKREAFWLVEKRRRGRHCLGY